LSPCFCGPAPAFGIAFAKPGAVPDPGKSSSSFRPPVTPLAPLAFVLALVEALPSLSEPEVGGLERRWNTSWPLHCNRECWRVCLSVYLLAVCLPVSLSLSLSLSLFLSLSLSLSLSLCYTQTLTHSLTLLSRTRARIILLQN
jgi:hypothetical protein